MLRQDPLKELHADAQVWYSLHYPIGADVCPEFGEFDKIGVFNHFAFIEVCFPPALLQYIMYKNIATGDTSQTITNLDIFFNSNPCHQKYNNKLTSSVDAIAISNLKLSMTHPLTD